MGGKPFWRYPRHGVVGDIEDLVESGLCGKVANKPPPVPEGDGEEKFVTPELLQTPDACAKERAASGGCAGELG